MPHSESPVRDVREDSMLEPIAIVGMGMNTSYFVAQLQANFIQHVGSPAESTLQPRYGKH